MQVHNVAALAFDGSTNVQCNYCVSIMLNSEFPLPGNVLRNSAQVGIALRDRPHISSLKCGRKAFG